MENHLKIAVIQSDLSWENGAENRSNFDRIIKGVDKVDLIILPEMFNTAFSMDSSRLAEKMDGETVSWMQIKAKETSAVVTGSVIIEDKGKFYNRLIWAQPNGDVQHYDKRHLFRMAEEDMHFSAGTERKVFNLKGWRICPMVCYDLRFPVWSRNIDAEGNTAYDLLLYVANWPAARVAAWSALLVGRAIENQAYVAGINRVGVDGNGIEYCGGTAMVDPKGNVMTSFPDGQVYVEITELDLDALNDFREKFPVVKDADAFELK